MGSSEAPVALPPSVGESQQLDVRGALLAVSAVVFVAGGMGVGEAVRKDQEETATTRTLQGPGYEARRQTTNRQGITIEAGVSWSVWNPLTGVANGLKRVKAACGEDNITSVGPVEPRGVFRATQRVRVKDRDLCFPRGNLITPATASDSASRRR